MTPVIRVDDEVWEWLKTHAQPLEDTPNSVLRRIAGLSDAGEHSSKENTMQHQSTTRRRVGRARMTMPRRERTNSGRELNDQWNVGARHALYHKDGNYYNHLRYFPGALFDPNGYVVFETEDEYRNSPYLQHGQQLHVPDGIAGMPGYVRMSDERSGNHKKP